MIRTGMKKDPDCDDQKNVYAYQGRSKGDTHIPEDPDGDLPFSLSCPVYLNASWQGVIFQFFLHVKDGLCRGPAVSICQHIHHPVQVLVVNRLLVGHSLDMHQFRQRNHAAGFGPEGHRGQGHDAGAVFSGHDHPYV
jgi:hypothetical protein